MSDKSGYERPSWDAYWMMSSMLIAERASCNKGVKVGAVIVKDNRQIATGYNGSPPGEPHCIDDDCLVIEEMGNSCQRVIHAESNAILQNSSACRGATIYVTHYPCLNCMKEIVSVGINRIVYWKKHKAVYYRERYEKSAEMADNSGVSVCKLSYEDAVVIINLLNAKQSEITKLLLEELI